MLNMKDNHLGESFNARTPPAPQLVLLLVVVEVVEVVVVV